MTNSEYKSCVYFFGTLDIYTYIYIWVAKLMSDSRI